jgi:Prealbumin-like fold domain
MSLGTFRQRPAGRRWLFRIATNTLGPASPTRRRRTITAVLTLAFLAAAAVIFVAGSSANLAGSTFEGNDGNLVVNTAGNHDWDNAPNLSVGVDLPTGQTDNAFGDGTHEAETSVSVVTGSIPNSKADLARFGVASEFVGGSNYLYLAWSRENASGSVNYDFEINQKTQPDLTTAGSKTLVRTAGDLLISYAFQGNSLTPDLTLRTWNGTAWGAAQPLSGSSEGAGNSAPVSDTLGGNPAVIRPSGQFGEAAINLTAAGVFPPGTCEAFGSAYVKSRSSQAFTSEIKDFIAPIAVNISNCGNLVVKKVTIPSPDPTNTAFAFSESGPGGFTDSFSLHNGESDTNNGLQAGTYAASETVPANWSLTSATCDNGNDPSAISIAPGSTVTCTFTNTLQQGAITVTKMAKHAASGNSDDHPLAGVSFTVEGVTKQTDANGQACFDGLNIGSHDVTEAQPAGYASDDASLTKSVNVDNAATCAGGGGESVSFHDTPLTNLSISVDSQVDGGTASTITCDNGGPNGSTGANGDGSASASNLRPGTYSCTIVVDP